MGKNRAFRQNLLAVLAAVIWGTAFVAQSESANLVPPFSFNAARSAIAVVSLGVIWGIFARARRKTGHIRRENPRDLLLGGLCCGSLIFLASYLQQRGLADTTAGKAGFITALYVVLVPVLGVFLGRKASLPVWGGAVLSVIGLYFLCIREDFSVGAGDFSVFLCAIVFAVHIFAVDYFARRVDGVHLCCLQFLTAAVLSGLCAMAFESPTARGLAACLPQLLYVGVLSSGVAYTLQILAQKDSDPTVVSILLSLESVFAVLAGAVVLGDRLTGREAVGCAAMFAAVILAQLPGGKNAEKTRDLPGENG